MTDLTGTAALVTGAAQGIGRAVAHAFLRAGASVAAVDNDRDALADLTCDASPFCSHPDLLALRADVSDENDVAHAVESAAKRFGRLDFLVANAGVFLEKPLPDLTLDEWSRVLSVNLTGTFLCARHAAPHLRKTRGAIVTIASTRAFQSEPHTEAYAASKGGIVSLTHALAASLGPDVRVNCIAPGWIDTRGHKKPGTPEPPPLRDIDHAQHPAGRVGTPEDVAAMALFLCSPAAGFATGACFTLDGGMTRKMIYAP